MRKLFSASRVIQTVALGLLCLPHLQATTTVLEDFNYGSSGSALGGLNGGTGFASGWSASNVSSYVTSGLTFADLYSTGGATCICINYGTQNRQLATPATGDIYGSFLFNSQTLGVGSGALQVSFTNSSSTAGGAVLPLNTVLGTNSIINNTFTGATTYLALFEGHFNGSSEDFTVWVLSAAQYTNLGIAGINATTLNSATIGTSATSIMNRVTYNGRAIGGGITHIVIDNSPSGSGYLYLDRITLSSTGLADFAAPEPSTWALCAGAFAIAATRLRRR